MKLAIMQPYFVPYIGYFALARAVDCFVMLDSVQYIRHGWVNRNRILHPTAGWQYIGLPLRKHSHQAAIGSIEIGDSGWRDRVLRQLQHYRRKAPHYDEVIAFLNDCLDPSIRNLAALNTHLLRRTCRYLGIRTEILLWSEQAISLPVMQHAGSWALEISSAMQASQYINPAAGDDLFREEEFTSRNIELSFLRMQNVQYDQRRPAFEPWLSVVDVLMFNSPSQALALAEAHDILNPQHVSTSPS